MKFLLVFALLSLSASAVINPPDQLNIGRNGTTDFLEIIDEATLLAEIGGPIDDNLNGTLTYTATIEFLELNNGTGQNGFGALQLFEDGMERLAIGNSSPKTEWGSFGRPSSGDAFLDPNGQTVPVVVGQQETITVTIVFTSLGNGREQIRINFRGEENIIVEKIPFNRVVVRAGGDGQRVSFTNISLEFTPLSENTTQPFDIEDFEQGTSFLIRNSPQDLDFGQPIDDTFEGNFEFEFEMTFDEYNGNISNFSRVTFYKGNNEDFAFGKPQNTGLWSAFLPTALRPVGSSQSISPFLDASNNPVTVTSGTTQLIKGRIEYLAFAPDQLFITFDGVERPFIIGDLSFDSIRLRQGRADGPLQVDLTNILFVVDGVNLPEPPLDRSQLPEPVFASNPALVDFYFVAWEQAWDRVVRHPTLPRSPYIDEAFADNTNWIWDTCFMTLFCKYSPDLFPGLESLENFYLGLYEPGDPEVYIQHPDNPPLFAWAEYDNYRFTGDTSRIQTLLNSTQYLQQHYQFFETLQPGPFPGKSNLGLNEGARQPDGWTWTGVASGMDNSPRNRGGDTQLWVDAIAQQGLSALYISRLATAIGDDALAAQWMVTYDDLKETVNNLYWDDEDGFYYDLIPQNSGGFEFSRIKTPASFWPVLAEMASPEQVQAMLTSVTDPTIMGGERPLTSVSRDDPDFAGSEAEDGDYWQGSVWLPTGYMAIKALEAGGQQEVADTTAQNLLLHMHRTFTSFSPATIWECYSPIADRPARRSDRNSIVRPDFSGWSALGPISLFIENVLGFNTIDADDRLVKWRLYQEGEHGIKRLRFGDVLTDITTDGSDWITVRSNESYNLDINGVMHSILPETRTFQAAPSTTFAEYTEAAGLASDQNTITDDPDNDGWANRIEFLYGTHPARGDSSPAVYDMEIPAMNGAQIASIDSSATLTADETFFVVDIRTPLDRKGLTLTVEGSLDLDTFQTDGINPLGSPSIVGDFQIQRYYLTPSQETERFQAFRLRVE